MYWSGLKTDPAKPGRRKNPKNNMQREEMGIVNGNSQWESHGNGNKHGRGMGMALWEWEGMGV